jgi:hypothetical protein
VTLRDDIECLERHARKNGDYLGDDVCESLDRVLAVAYRLAAMSPEQLDAMLVQTTALHVSWSQAAAHALTDEENRRSALISEGYQALAESLRAVKS